MSKDKWGREESLALQLTAVARIDAVPRRMKYNVAIMDKNKKLLTWTAVLSMLALVAHAIDVPDHLSEWWGYGAFFVIIASFQFFYGMALFLKPWRYDENGGLRPNAEQYGRGYFLLGTVLTSAVLIVYVITRTTGMPFLGADAIVEPVTPLSLLPPLECVPLLYCHVRLLNLSQLSPKSRSKFQSSRKIESAMFILPGHIPA